MKQGYGSADTDKVGKERTDKPLSPRAGGPAPYTGMVGGPSNEAVNTSNAKGGGKSMNQGSKVPSPPRDSIPPYKEGGFRNAAMEHKR